MQEKADCVLDEVKYDVLDLSGIVPVCCDPEERDDIRGGPAVDANMHLPLEILRGCSVLYKDSAQMGTYVEHVDNMLLRERVYVLNIS